MLLLCLKGVNYDVSLNDGLAISSSDEAEVTEDSLKGSNEQKSSATVQEDSHVPSAESGLNRPVAPHAQSGTSFVTSSSSEQVKVDKGSGVTKKSTKVAMKVLSGKSRPVKAKRAAPLLPNLDLISRSYPMRSSQNNSEAEMELSENSSEDRDQKCDVAAGMVTTHDNSSTHGKRRVSRIPAATTTQQCDIKMETNVAKITDNAPTASLGASSVQRVGGENPALTSGVFPVSCTADNNLQATASNINSSQTLKSDSIQSSTPLVNNKIVNTANETLAVDMQCKSDNATDSSKPGEVAVSNNQTDSRPVSSDDNNQIQSKSITSNVSIESSESKTEPLVASSNNADMSLTGPSPTSTYTSQTDSRHQLGEGNSLVEAKDISNKLSSASSNIPENGTPAKNTLTNLKVEDDSFEKVNESKQLINAATVIDSTCEKITENILNSSNTMASSKDKQTLTKLPERPATLSVDTAPNASADKNCDSAPKSSPKKAVLAPGNKGSTHARVPIKVLNKLLWEKEQKAVAENQASYGWEAALKRRTSTVSRFVSSHSYD